MSVKDSVLERFFLKKLILSKGSRLQINHEKLPSVPKSAEIMSQSTATVMLRPLG